MPPSKKVLSLEVISASDVVNQSLFEKSSELDMLKLINFVKEQVKKKYKIELELEIKIVD